MNRIARVLLILVVLGIAFSSPAWAFKRTAVGEDGYEFTLETLDGASYTLSENLAEKATLLVFWAAWSPRSHDILADFQKLHEAHAGEGLHVVAINVEHPEWDPTEMDKISATATNAGVTYPVVLDKDYIVFNDYGVVAVPSTVMMDSTGTITGMLENYSTMVREGFREEVLRQLEVFIEPEVVEEKVFVYKPKGASARYHMMGKRLVDRKRYKRALTQLERAVAIDPDYAEAHRTLATVYDKLNRSEEAGTALARAEALDAANPALKETTSTAPEGQEKQAAPASVPEKESPAEPERDNSRVEKSYDGKTATLVR